MAFYMALICYVINRVGISSLVTLKKAHKTNRVAISSLKPITLFIVLKKI